MNVFYDCFSFRGLSANLVETAKPATERRLQVSIRSAWLYSVVRRQCETNSIDTRTQAKMWNFSNYGVHYDEKQRDILSGTVKIFRSKDLPRVIVFDCYGLSYGSLAVYHRLQRLRHSLLINHLERMLVKTTNATDRIISPMYTT